MEKENDFHSIELALIQIIDSNKTIRKKASKIIEKIEETNDCFGLFMEILFRSTRQKAINQASTQICFILRLRIIDMDVTIKDFLKQNFIEYLIKVQDKDKKEYQIVFNNIRECILILVESEKNQIWAELDQYIDLFLDNQNFYQISILGAIIPRLNDQFIEEKYEIYCQIAALAISMDNFEINSAGIAVLSILVKTSKNLEGFEASFEKIDQLLEYLQSPEQQRIDQSFFWSSINSIIKNEIFPTELLTSVMNFFMNQEIDESTSLLVLDAIQPSIKNFTLEQIFPLIQQIVFFSNKFIENEEKLPIEFMHYIDKCFTYFPHSQIYEFLKKIIAELLTSSTPLAITLFWPVILGAYEQVTKDLDYLIEILKAGFVSENSLIIESCALILESVSEISQIIFKCLDPLFPVVLPLLMSSDSDIRSSAFNSIQSFFDLHDIKNDVSFVTSLWSCKEKIASDDYETYFFTLGHAISCSEQLDDSQVHEILESIQQMITDSSSSISLVSYSLYVIGQLINNGEFSEIESFIPSTFDAVQKCLSYENEEIVYNALSYTSEISDSYGETVSEMLNEIWPLIEKLLVSHKCKENVLQLSLVISCDIAVICKKQDAFEQVSIYLDEEYNKEHYETFLKIASRIVKLADEGTYQSLFDKINEIVKNDKDLDEVKLSFRALYKFLKYAPEKLINEAIQKSAEIINMFFEGSLPCLDDMSVLNPEVDVDVDLVDYFSEFLAKFVSYPSQYVESACENALKIANREEHEFKNLVIQIFIDAFENGTLPENVSLDLVDNLESFLSTDDECFQQNIVYLLIIFLKKYPANIDHLSKYIPTVSEWWNQSMSNKTRYSLVIANIASLFLRIESLTSSIPQDLLDQLIDFYPPSDLSETQGMSENIITIFNRNQESKQLSPYFKGKTAIGIAKLLTESSKKLKKINLQSTTKERITDIFRSLCQDQEILQAVMESLSKNEKRQQTISEILQA